MFKQPLLAALAELKIKLGSEPEGVKPIKTFPLRGYENRILVHVEPGANVDEKNLPCQQPIVSHTVTDGWSASGSIKGQHLHVET